MTTLFSAPISPLKIDDSPYRDLLESVAPNITVLISSAATVPENWWETLARILPSINSTPAQDSQLMEITNRAASGLNPVGYVEPVTPILQTPMTAEKFLTYASVAGLLWRILR